jgi:diguanylate cyclase
VLNDLRRPIPYKDNLLRVGVSIGIAMYPADGTTVADLIKAADESMYEVKRDGKSGAMLTGGGIQRASELAGRTGKFRQVNFL